jgi:AhpD family alkylhydroperoxidase
VSISGVPVRLVHEGRADLPAETNERSPSMVANGTTTAPYLSPVEKPRTLFMRLGFAFMRKKYGKVMTPASVFSARMPTAFTLFYGKVGKLDRKLVIPAELVALLREAVATTNGCAFCMDASRAAALEKWPSSRQKLDELSAYGASRLFSERERAALDYATELTATRSMSEGTFSELRRHFDEREIGDVVWVVASEHLYNVNNIGLNIGSDGLCDLAERKQRHEARGGRR